MGLFDKHIHVHGRTEYVPYEKTVTTHEHRAPTDKSVELLNEFQQKAIDNILCQYRVNTNHVKDTNIIVFSQAHRDTVQYHVKYSINGEEHSFAGEIARRDIYANATRTYMMSTAEVILPMLVKHISETIAVGIMKSQPEIIDTINGMKR